MSNYWCKDDNQMKVKKDVMFNLYSGKDFEYHLRCEVTKGKQEVPFVVRPVSVEAVLQRYE